MAGLWREYKQTVKSKPNLTERRGKAVNGGGTVLPNGERSALLGSPCLQGELAFDAASQCQMTERIFVRLTVGILTAFICRHQCVRGSSQSRL